MLRKPSGVMVSSAVIHLTHTIYLHKQKFASIIGKDKILGVSVQTVEQALLAQSQGANYLGVGSIFTTTSKDDAKSVSINTLKEICNAVNIPVVAIGGIDKDNVKQLSQTGISGIAVISAIYANKNIKSATMKLKELIKEIIK